MFITNENLKRTTQERHRPTRTYLITPRGGLTKRVEVKMPKINYIPTLWK